MMECFFSTDYYVNGFGKELVEFMRGLLIGITRVSKESIFSDLNNLTAVTTKQEKYYT